MIAEMTRGQNVALTREIPNLAGVVLGVAWDAGSESVLADNLVMATILCGADGTALSPEHFVFFNQLQTPDLSVHQLDQQLAGDQEQVEIDLAAVPADVQRIVVAVYVNEGTAAKRSLGQLRRIAVRVLNLADNSELVRSENLSPALSVETGIALGEVYRNGNDWKFKVVGQGYGNGLIGIAGDYRVPL